MENQMKYGAALAYINLIVKTAAQLFYIPLLVRFLGQHEYGLYTLALGIASFLTILNLGIDSSYIHFFSKTRREDTNDISKLNALYFTLFCVLGMVAFCVGLLLSLILHYIFPSFNAAQIDSIRKMLLLLTVNVSLSFPLGLFNSFAVAHEKHAVSKLVMIMTNVLNPICAIIALQWGGGAISVVAIMVATSIIPQLAMTTYAFAVLKFRLKFTKNQTSIIQTILSFSSLVFLQIVAEQANWNIDKILLGRYQNPEAIAIYGTGAQIHSMYMSVALAISGLFTPSVHRLAAEGSFNELDILFRKVGNAQFFVVGLVMSGFVLFGKQFIHLWIGEVYDDSYVIALLLMLPATVDLIQNTGIEIQRAMGLQKDRTLVYLVVSFMNLLVSVPLCRLWGGVGCALGTALSFVICNVLYMNCYYWRRLHLRIDKFWRMIAKKALPTVVLTVLGYLLSINVEIANYHTLIMCIVTYSLIYATVYLGIDCYSKEDNDVRIFQ